jgi:histone arginine demethylase JMJD6
LQHTLHPLSSFGLAYNHMLMYCLQVGSDDDGYAVRLRFEHFLRYCAYPHHACSDDSPLYIFDGTFADRSGSAAMAKQYSVPGLFQEDLFQLAGERRRPPYRLVLWYIDDF